jgi:hypothetical protein
MKTEDSWNLIQGDEGSRDGHYREKQNLRQKTGTSVGADVSAELDPNDSTSLQAQNQPIWASSGSGSLPKRLPALPPSGIRCSTELVKWVRFDRPKRS